MKNELTSLNTKIYEELNIEELEERLEMAAWSCECEGTNCDCNGFTCGCNVDVCGGVNVCPSNNPCGTQGGE